MLLKKILINFFLVAIKNSIVLLFIFGSKFLILFKINSLSRIYSSGVVNHSEELDHTDDNLLVFTSYLYDEDNNSYIIFWNDNRSSGKEDLVNIYVQSITVESVECLLGDVTSDGLLNVLDIVNLVNYIFGMGDFTDEQLCAADLNIDGIKVNKFVINSQNVKGSILQTMD